LIDSARSGPNQGNIHPELKSMYDNFFKMAAMNKIYQASEGNTTDRTIG